jgi:hypothetical protein
MPPEEGVGGRAVLAVVRRGKVMEVGERSPRSVLDLGSGGAVATGEEILMPHLLGLVVDVAVGAVEVIPVGIGIGIGISIGRIAFLLREGMIHLLRGVVVVGVLEEAEETIGARDLAREARRGGGIVVTDFYAFPSYA